MLTMPYSIANRNRVMVKADETPGCGEVFAGLVGKGFKEWCTWYAKSGLDIAPPSYKKPSKAATGKYAGKKFSWTGYRSAEQEALVVAGGGEVIKLGAKTDVLFYNPEGKFMAKVDAAKDKGITVALFGKF
jgi:hypothetical protein